VSQSIPEPRPAPAVEQVPTCRWGKRCDENAWHRGLCPDHAAHLARRTLGQLPRWYALLPLVLAPSISSLPGDRVSGSRSGGAALRLEVQSLIEDLPSVLLCWEDDLRERMGWSDRTRRCRCPEVVEGRLRHCWDHARRPNVLAETCDWLTRHVDLIVERHPAPGEFLDELGRQDRLVKQALDRRMVPIKVEEPCPGDRCGRRTLIRFPGDDCVRCATDLGGCGRIWPEKEYGLMQRLAAFQAGLVQDPQGTRP